MPCSSPYARTRSLAFVSWLGLALSVDAVAGTPRLADRPKAGPAASPAKTTDSEAGPRLRISDLGGTGSPSFDALFPAVAYNSQDDELLVVWAGDDDVGGLIDGEDEIFGQRIDATTGAPLGTNDFRISDMGGTGNSLFDALTPDVAYNPIENEYLVVWVGDHNSGGLVDGEIEVFGQRLDASTGLPVGVNDFRISDLGGTGNPSFGAVRPRVVFNSARNEYLVVWAGDDNVDGLVEGETEIFGQRIDGATGAEVGANDFRISDMGPNGSTAFLAFFATVAYNSVDDEYLVVWAADNDILQVDDEIEIFTQRLSGLGAEIGVNDLRISAMGTPSDANYDALEPAVVYNSVANEFLVVWSADDDSSDLVDDEFEIYGQRLSAAGAEIGPDDFRISDMGGTGDEFFGGLAPRVGFDGLQNQYFVVWYGDDDRGGLVQNELEVFAQRVTAAGAEVGWNDFRLSAMGGSGNTSYSASFPVVIPHPTAPLVLVAWHGDDDTDGLVDGEFEIFATQVATPLFEDDFESSTTDAWSLTIP